MTIDLANLDTSAACDLGAEIELLHPVTRAPLGIFWGMLGRDSAVVQEYTRERYDTDVRKAAQARKRGKEPEVLLHADVQARGIDLLLAASTHWRTGDAPTLTLDGEALPFTKAHARRVLERLTWIKDQIDAGAADLENFLKV